MVKRLPAAYLLFFLLLSVLFAPCDAAAAGQSPRKVLLLTSYHQGDRWNDSVVQGVRQALGGIESVRLSIENLDMRRYTNQDHIQMTMEYLRGKYHARPQDLILVSDDPALNFLLTVREELFPDTPVVFCGVNNFTPKRILGQQSITGINEALSLDATLELALKLFPKTTRIFAVVSDTEASGRVNLQQYRTAAARMKSLVQFDELLNITGENAPEILSRLPKDSLVLRLINILKPEGGYLSIQDSIRILSTHAPVPVFTLWSFDLGDGALGGYVSSGQDQGHTAGNLAIRILEGQEAEQIPVIMNSPNVPMFDYKIMERFGLKESALPKGSVVLNHQLTMWEQYWDWLLGIALFCGLQTFLILNLLTRGKRLHAANAALGESEHFTRSLLETIPVPVFYKGRDGHYQGFNKAFLKFLGKSNEELIGKSVFDITSPDMAKVYHAHDMELFENPGTQIYPYQIKTSQGDLRDVIFHKASLTEEHGVVTGLIGAILDVTEQKKTEIALQESERRFKNLHNASFGGIIIHDKGNILDCNQGLSHITGYTYEELIGKNGLLLIAEQSRELVMTNISAGYEKPYEAFGLRKNGEVYPLRLEARNIPYQGREVRVVEFRDISESKRAEEALRESEERFLLAMKASNDGLFDWDLKTNEIYYSPAWKKMLGYEDHELPNDFSIWENSTAPEGVKKSWEMQQQLILKQIDRFVLEFKMKHKDGHWVDILSRAEALFDESGQAVRIVGTHTDITERRQAEEQIRKSEEQFRNLYDEAPVGYFEYDLQGNITRVNHRYLKMLGYTAEEMLGQPCWKFIFDEFAREQILAKLDGVRPPGVGLERIYQRQDGTTFPVLFEDRLLLDEEGHIKGIRTAVQDITELKQTEEEREKLQAQLTQAQKMESVGRLAGGVAHDFNNMLGVIFGHTEMAL
ncbi:MAG: ABC transporter substrate binding protein, partial [Desulforhopalus sp.]|nr:ABC transporter substrate binding protein [Desulforhopalus sp.]